MVDYRSDIADLRSSDLDGFFAGWPDPPSATRRLEILRAADLIELATEGAEVIGFATAITDGLFAAFIPLVEVKRAAQGRGVGTELVRRLTERLKSCYSIDLVCDESVVPFYERSGWSRLAGMGIRHRENLDAGDRGAS